MSNSQITATTDAVQPSQTGLTAFEISGEDATRFLHAQLTSDVESQAIGSHCWTSWLTPKGRVIAVMVNIRLDTNHYLLMVPDELSLTLAKRLKMFVMRSSVDIISQRWCPIVYTGDAAQNLIATSRLNEHRLCISGERVLVDLTGENNTGPVGVIEIANLASGDSVEQLNVSAVGESEENGWLHWCVNRGLPWIVTETTDSFIPQSLNLDAIGGLSFEKGCYPGQEIVARTHFKGRLKYRSAILEFEDVQNLNSGTKLTQPSDPARSATVLTVDRLHRCATAVVPLQWFEHPNEIVVTVQKASTSISTQSEQESDKSGTTTTAMATPAQLKSPPYELSLS